MPEGRSHRDRALCLDCDAAVHPSAIDRRIRRQAERDTRSIDGFRAHGVARAKTVGSWVRCRLALLRSSPLILLSHNVAAFADEESCIWQDSLFSKRGAEMDLPKSGDATSRFLAFVEGLTSVIGHADRATPLRDYCVGLMMPGERKSVEPMAAITAPERTAAQHQSLLHFV